MNFILQLLKDKLLTLLKLVTKAVILDLWLNKNGATILSEWNSTKILEILKKEMANGIKDEGVYKLPEDIITNK